MDSPHFELAPPELRIPLKANHAGRTYSLAHRLRPPAADDWFVYEAALRLAVEELPPHTGGEHGSSEPRYRFHARSADAAAALWDRLVLDIEGYALPSATDIGSGTVPSPSRGEESHSDSSPVPPGQSVGLRSPQTKPGLPSGLSSEKTGDNPAGLIAATPMEDAERARAGQGFSPANKTVGRRLTAEGSQGKPPSPAGGRPGSPEQSWQSLVPLAHKEAAIRSLTLVAPAELEDAQDGGLLPLAAERIPVVLEAARAGEAFPGLQHWFRPPSLDDERRYRRLMAETLMVGGSRGSRALIPPRLPALCRLYDSLIFSVERYALNSSVEISAEQLVRHMDAWHKRAAVQVLFGDADGAEPTGDPLGGANDEGVA